MHVENTNQHYHYWQQYLSWKNHKTPHWQMVFIFFVEGQLLKYPSIRLENEWSKWKKLQNPSREEAIVFLDNFQWKKLKGKVLVALKKFIMDEWPAVVIDFIPSAMSVLKMQTEGYRPLSLLVHRVWDKPIMHRSDIFDFLNHDLEHLYMFNFDDGLKMAQHQFFQKLQMALNSKTLAFNDSADFNRALDYLLSDMNTHPIHSLKYLRAQMAVGDVEGWRQIGLSMGMDECILESFARIGGPGLSEVDVKNVSNFFT